MIPLDVCLDVLGSLLKNQIQRFEAVRKWGQSQFTVHHTYEKKKILIRAVKPNEAIILIIIWPSSVKWVSPHLIAIMIYTPNFQAPISLPPNNHQNCISYSSRGSSHRFVRQSYFSAGT